MSVLKLLNFHHILMLSVFTGAANGYYYYRWSQCIYSSPDLSDMEFIEGSYFNKYPFVKYNSTVGIFVGFTEFGVKNAEMWNKDPSLLQQYRAQVEVFCKPNAKLMEADIYNKTVQPKVKLSLVMPGDSKHPALLMCSAYDFYPQPIKVSWLKDGAVVTSEVTSTEELPNGDWYYQIHSELEYTPRSEEKISCMVEHASFTKPMIYDWNPPAPEFEWDIQLLFTIESAALLLGIIIAAAGFIYYKIKSTVNLFFLIEKILVPH
ncbi:rano class II histocompatibility antigen, A beta chain isoform X2 [Ctenopharyngodon idella]|uniref:rano class II histocompatibility antigen, A beta chain isoform X2 n=1 Tax=Ctenopharyngodon idella TaxID=7959 RepID=UPI00223271AE|nr:rano class II histocompatibility antigen, A beta chain isoform X2 [Ctenopharyngodon idella]